MKNFNIAYHVERLLIFAVRKKIIEETDVIYTRNLLLDMLHIDEPYNLTENSMDKNIDEDLETATPILSHILDYCAEIGIISNNTITNRDLMDAKIMGAIMARPSDIIDSFNSIKNSNIERATDWFYELNRNVNYIQVDRINKNLYWKVDTEFGDLEITVNLSKPEKDPNEIAVAGKLVLSDYPECLLCAENEGFAGHINHPARQNLRLIPLKLDGEDWYFQYSPYVYYNEHCIVLNKKHTPMLVSEKTFRRLFDFIDIMPHYCIGSNAGIPIVGGSILSHDHYQGGRYTFPMEKAENYACYTHTKSEYSDLNISLVKWAMPVIRICGKNRNSIISLASDILDTWLNYSDADAGITAYTDNIQHNAITPIARINKNNLYELDIVLRNNITSKEHPLGVFHPHEKLHHIKKENIGLIEVMGLAILPGRLDRELLLIERILTGESPYNKYNKEQICNDNDLSKHFNWINELVAEHGTNNTAESANNIIKDGVGRIFKEVLCDAGVFKFTEKGRVQFDKFMRKCGFVKKLCKKEF